MKRLKHSKVKNTGLIFELLVRQVASDTMNNKSSKALNVIKKHFHTNSELSKELKLYRTVSTEKFKTENKAEKFVEDLKSNFNVGEFFKSRVSNYKLHASTYKLFEYAEADDPKEYVDSRFTVTEHVATQPLKKEKSNGLSSEHKDVRILASKMVVDKFNEKYSKLSTEQKRMLREYINNVSNSVNLKKYVMNETKKLQNLIISQKSSVPSKVIRIKLNEVATLLNKLNKKHIVEDKDVLTMLRYYELVNELKKVETK